MFSISFIWRYLDLANEFFFKYGHRVLDVIIVCCYFCLILFVVICFFNNGWSHQSNSAFFSSLSYLRWRRSFSSHTFIFKYLLRSFIMEWSHIFSSEVKSLASAFVLFKFSFIWRFFELANNFFKYGHRVLDVINVCCYFCLILLFVLICFLNNGWSHQSNSFFYSIELSALKAIFLFIYIS